MNWKTLIEGEKKKSYFDPLWSYLKEEYAQREVFPPHQMVFNAFRYCRFRNTKVVIIGQDPYHTRGAAQGLAFSVAPGTPKPPSLVNILKELSDDIGIDVTDAPGDLSGWAKQGVLLLNTVLTVREGEANSHQGKGWEQFTENMLRRLVQLKTEPLVFICWGNTAKRLYNTVIGTTNLREKTICLSSRHPSPFSAYDGFFGSKPFSQANKWLESTGQTPIDWTAGLV